MTTFKRATAMLLAVLMFIQCTPLTALAEDSWATFSVVHEGTTYHSLTFVDQSGNVAYSALVEDGTNVSLSTSGGKTTITMVKGEDTKTAEVDALGSNFSWTAPGTITGDTTVTAATTGTGTARVGVMLNGQFAQIKTVDVSNYSSNNTNKQIVGTYLVFHLVSPALCIRL